MTNRWKRLTALLLVLLTLLNAGSALAAEEFWKWGDVYEEKLILGQPAKVASLQVFKDELYFVYGDLLLKCHDPESTPETVYELKNLVPENVYPDSIYCSYHNYQLFTDGEAMYILVNFLQRIYRLEFQDGEVLTELYATLDYSSLPELQWEAIYDGAFYLTNMGQRIVKLQDKIYMLASGWNGAPTKLIHSLICFSLDTGRGEILAYNEDNIMEVVSWQENPEWASTLLVFQIKQEWTKEQLMPSVDNRALAIYDTDNKKVGQAVLKIADTKIENQIEYDLDYGAYSYNPTCKAFAWDAENRRIFFLHDDVAWYTDGKSPARGFDRIPMDAYKAEFGFFWKENYYFVNFDGDVYVCDMSRVPQTTK